MIVPWIVGAVGGSVGGSILGPVGDIATGVMNWVAPIQMPGFEQLTQLFISGFLSDNDYRRLARGRGWNIPELKREELQVLERNPFEIPKYSTFLPERNLTLNERLVQISVPMPTVDECVRAYYRKIIDGAALQDMLTRQGVADLKLQDVYIKLAEEIPGPSDLIRFAVREAFTPSIVQQYHYQDELPIDVFPWMAKQGLVGDTGIPRPPGIDGNGNPLPGGNATWFDLYWWSHWELPSVGQGYEMAQRLYPNSRYGPSPDATPGTFFSSADLSTLLKTNDYPSYWRERLEAISYTPLGRVDVRRMYQLGIMGEQSVYHAYRAMGYNDRNAMQLVAFTKKQKQLADAKASHVRTKAMVLNSFKIGLIDAAEATEQLTELGIEQVTVYTLIREMKQQIKYETVQKVLKQVKHAYLTGQISTDQMTGMLVSAGMNSDTVERYRVEWQLERQYQYKQNSTGELLQSYHLGLIDENELTSRLFNLTYKSKEVTTIVNLAIRKRQIEYAKQVDKVLTKQAKEEQHVIKEQAKADEKLRKQAEQNATKKRREEIAQQKQQLAIQKDRLATALAPYTEANIVKMHDAGVLPENQIREILTLKGWTEQAQNKFIAAIVKKVKPKGNIDEASQTPIDSGA